ncbi:MAG TPA: hypothetical protein VMM92_13135, partial [Thermoanaerobaculia bacterium]|nr:hypothetical protein [Thermoanaerobaculia bacterium]
VSGRRGLLATATLFLVAAGVFGAYRLSLLLAVWKTAGVLSSRLWWVCAAAWGAAGTLGVLVLREQAADERARLLFTLPLSPAERARALFLATVTQLSNLGLLSTIAVGGALVRTLGAGAWPWLAAVLLGQGGALATTGALLGLAATLKSPPSRRLAAELLLAAAAAAGILWRWAPVRSPGVVAVLWGLALLLALGPLAGALGRLYEQAFHQLLGTHERPARRRIARWLVRGLADWRSPTAALLSRGLLTRGRQWIDWARLGMILGPLALYPRLQPALDQRGLPASFTLPGVVALLGFLLIVDAAASPLGAEGNRLALLLTAPISLGQLLRAKLAVLAAPLLAGGALVTLVLGRASGAAPRQVAFATLAASLILLGLTALFAWGSAWDADLDLEIEGGLRGILQEQTPLTPIRGLLVLLGSTLLALDLLCLRALPEAAVLAALAGIDLLALGLAWRSGLAGLRRLTAR